MLGRWLDVDIPTATNPTIGDVGPTSHCYLGRDPVAWPGFFLNGGGKKVSARFMRMGSRSPP